MFLRKRGMRETQEELSKFAIQQMGFGPVGEIHMLGKSGQNSYNYYRSRVEDANLHTVVSKAEDALVTKRNDVMLVCPSSHTWYGDSHVAAAALTWDKQNTHMVGMGPSSKSGYGRCRFSNGAACANMMTVSGAYNMFKNIRWMHGYTSSATDVTLMTISGAGNVFEGCNFASPIDATQGASANFNGVLMSGCTSNYMKDCLFGTNNAVDRNGASAMLTLQGGGGLNVYENCIFRSHSTDSAFFIDWNNTSEQCGFGHIFLNCQFVNRPATSEGLMDYAINANSQQGNNYLYFDNRCSFIGVDDIIAEGSEGKVILGTVPYISAATYNGLQTTADYQ